MGFESATHVDGIIELFFNVCTSVNILWKSYYLKLWGEID